MVVSEMNQCIFHDIGPGRQDRRIFEIVEQAYKGHAKVLIFTQNEERAASIDRTLWIIKQEAFIPHKIFHGNEPDSAVPIGIVTAEINPIKAGILIADGHCSLDFACSFDRVHEFVDKTSAQTQQACRDRYRAYRTRQVPIEHLKE
jgi:DNA polymerase IIIc chi subunit